MTIGMLDEARHLLSSDGNLSVTERSLSVVGGLALAAVAAQPRPNKFLSLIALAAGAALAIRGATGFCAVKSAISNEGMAPRG